MFSLIHTQFDFVDGQKQFEHGLHILYDFVNKIQDWTWNFTPKM